MCVCVDLSFNSYLFKLFREDSKLFPDRLRDMVSPEYTLSSSVSSPSWTGPEHLPKEMSAGPVCLMNPLL